MGQIFYACAYDIETKTCCVYDADKFHANCYSFSGAVYSMHYLLRKKPYRIMWGGQYVALENRIANFSRLEDLLGISTFMEYDEFNDCKNSSDEDICNKLNIIKENEKLWKEIDVWDDAKKYFNWDHTHSATYNGYLLNHTQKVAVDLGNYHEQSKYVSEGVTCTVDLIPVLTETGDGTQMLFFDGLSVESTESLAGEWCGDLLQIVDELPVDYKLINCCFSKIWDRAKYCYNEFGVDGESFVLRNSDGKRVEVAKLNLFGKRSQPGYVKFETSGEKACFKTVAISP